MIPAEVVAPKADYPRPQANLPFLRAIARTRETLQRIKELGYTVGSHINLDGEHFELVSEPVKDGNCTVVQVVSANDPACESCFFRCRFS